MIVFALRQEIGWANKQNLVKNVVDYISISIIVDFLYKKHVLKFLSLKDLRDGQGDGPAGAHLLGRLEGPKMRGT